MLLVVDRSEVLKMYTIHKLIQYGVKKFRCNILGVISVNQPLVVVKT